MYHSIFKRCVTDQPIQFKPLIHIVGDFVFYDVTVKSNHIAVLPSLSVSSAQPLSKLNARADFPGIGYAPHRSSHLLGLQFREVFYTVTNIRTPQRTVSSMQRFAVSQKNRTEAITISPFSLHLLYRAENKQFSTLRCTKTGGTQLKLRAVCFVVQSCLADADFVVFSNYCLIGTRLMASFFACIGAQPARISNFSTPCAAAARDISSSSPSTISLVSAEMVTPAQPLVGMVWLMVRIFAPEPAKIDR